MSVTKGHIYLKNWRELEETRPRSREAKKSKKFRAERDAAASSSSSVVHIHVRRRRTTEKAPHGVFSTPEEAEAFRQKAKLKKLINIWEIPGFQLISKATQMAWREKGKTEVKVWDEDDGGELHGRSTQSIS